MMSTEWLWLPTKKLVSPLSNISNYFGVWGPQILLHEDLINLTSAVFWVGKKIHAREVSKIIHMFTWIAIVLPFKVWWWGDMWKSPCKSYGCKKWPKKQKIGSTNDAWKGYLKNQIRWYSQSFQGLPLDPTKGDYSAPYEPPAEGANVLMRVGSWPTVIKLNPSWKTEFSKSACIKPWQ